MCKSAWSAQSILVVTLTQEQCYKSLSFQCDYTTIQNPPKRIHCPLIQHLLPTFFFLLLESYLPMWNCSALHKLMQYGFVSFSSYKTLSISRQQDILLRSVAGITAAADFSGLARSCPMAQKLSEDCHRAE